VLPNYRLVPEHTGADILEDLADFWKWFHAGKLDAYLSSLGYADLELDYNHLLATGDSAGGYMALMSALTQPKGSIKAVLAQYPMTNSLRPRKGPTFFGMPSPGPEVLDQHLATVKPGTVISSAIPPARNSLSYSMGAYGRHLEFFGRDEKLWPLGLIADAKWMPPTWIIHGDNDSAVDIGDSRAFVEQWKNGNVDGEVRLTVQEGQEHGFDIALKEDEEAWLKQGLEWMSTWVD